MMDVCGEYVTRCFYSNTWQLREAALMKVSVDLSEGRLSASPGDVLSTVAHMVARASDDRIAQVFLASANALSACMEAVEQKVSKGDIHKALEPVLNKLTFNLGHTNQRCKDAAQGMLLELASSPSLGAPIVSRFLCHKLPKKQANAWKALTTRLNTMVLFVREFGLQASGLTPDELTAYIKSYNAHAHANKHVRNAAKDVAVELYKALGLDVDNYLDYLSGPQMKEYQVAFEEVTAEVGGIPGAE
jgi:hypothetical protein